MKLKTTLSLAILAAATIAGAAQTYDVTMTTRDSQGRVVRANIDRNDVAEAQKIFRESKNTQKLRDLAERRRAKSPEVPEEGEGFRITFAVENEESLLDGYFYEPWKVYVTQGGQYGGSYYNYAYFPLEEDGWWGCYVPEGTYYVILSSTLIKEDRTDSYPLYVVKTAVDIKSDMTITFRQSDAKNLLTCDFSFPDGTKTDLDDGNYYSFFSCLNNSDGGYCFNIMSGGPNDAIYVNNLDDRWTYAINHIAVTPEGTYVDKLVEQGPFSSNRHFTNIPADYVELSTHFGALPTTDRKINGYGASTEMTWQGIYWRAGAGVAMIFEGDYTGEPKLWINNKRSDMSPTTGFDVLVSPVVIERIETIDYGDYQDEYSVLAFGPLMISESTGAPYTCVSYEGYTRPGFEDELFFLPDISPFDYTADSPTFFSMAPVLNAYSFRNFHNKHLDKDFLFLESNPAYPGFEETDLPLALTITNGGKTETIDAAYLWDWCSEGNYTPGPTSVELSATYATDGDSPRHTVSRYSFDSSGKEEDFAVPSIKRYQLRDADGAFTDAATSEGSIIFQVNMDDVTVKTEYAVGGSGEWTPLQIEDAGGYYNAALAGIDSSLTGKRLDLRFSVADAEGNSAEQTIEGAFIFGSKDSLTDTASDAEPISTIFYNLQGQRVASDFEGIVICVSTMADGSIRTAKRLNR